MTDIATLADKIAVETEAPVESRWTAKSLYEQLAQTAGAYPTRPAVSFQLTAGPTDKVETLTWTELKDRVTRLANFLRAHRIEDGDVVAYILPNCNEAVIAMLAGATAGIVLPVNPLLEAHQIAGILRDTEAKIVVTLAPFPKTEINAHVSEALEDAPSVHTMIEVDLNRYLAPPKSWLVPLLRPKRTGGHGAKVIKFADALNAHRGDALDFEEPFNDRVCAYFHTGGTTGMPKVAQHKASGILYNGWCGNYYIFKETDVLICPLPMFHVFAAYPVLFSCLLSGAHMVMPTPAGYRGDGVFENFWKLIERYGVTFLITVPTAAAKLMDIKIDANISTLHTAISGSAPLPAELLRRFEEATKIPILEGYGMTEATCLVSINPPAGERKVGSVGLPFPYCDVRILTCDETGAVQRDCGVDEIGEICVANPGVMVGHTYTEAHRNEGLFADGKYLRTGDMGRIDADGYIWITGRAKDMIIRGGHNVDPAQIEEALMTHPEVAFAGAIGQPDAHSGELPAAYVELREGGSATVEDLVEHANARIGERAAHPKYLEIMGELPKTAVGKVFKPDLRRAAITRVYGEVLAEAGVAATVERVDEDKLKGLVAKLRKTGEVEDAAVTEVLGTFARPWAWAD